MSSKSSEVTSGEPIGLTIAKILSTAYGPYAFGLIMFVVIWFFAIQPQLEAQRIDWQSQQQIILKLNELNRNQLVVSQTMDSTAKVLERTVEKLERMNHGQ
jgi:hypothetical protein